MNQKQKIIVSITGIFIVLLALVGLTYAYFLTQIRGNEETKSISVSTANLILEYKDGNGIIKAENLLPGKNIPPKIFEVVNKGNKTVENFNIYLENVQNQFSRKEDLTYTLECYNITEGAASSECEDFEVVENEVTTDDELIFPSVMSVIAKDTLEPATEDTPAETHRYYLKVTYKNHEDIDQSIDMNKLLQAKVNIYDEKTKFLASEIMNNVSETGTRYIEPDMLGVAENTTSPGETGSLENEKVLSYTFDDLGTSYYYRGNVDNNFVNFAGMCWRIVRINGDGSVKLILEDRYTTCDDIEDTDGTGTTDYAYTGNWSDKKTYLFGHDANKIVDFLNYTGGLADSFKTFQTTKLTNILEKMKVDEWCYDNSVTEIDNYGKEYYGAYTRINTNKKPSLICTGTKLTKFKDDTDMYIGTLTADEISFAGAPVPSNFSQTIYNYLVNSYTKTHPFWLLSPAGNDMGGGADGAFFLSGDFFTLDSIVLDYYSRPAISLKSTTITTIKTNVDNLPGTINNPYVIN